MGKEQNKEINQFLADFDAEKLSYNWKSAYPLADDLQTKVYEAIQLGVSESASRRDIFEKVWILAHNACEQSVPALPPECFDSAPVPAMSEPWYCSVRNLLMNNSLECRTFSTLFVNHIPQHSDP